MFVHFQTLRFTGITVHQQIAMVLRCSCTHQVKHRKSLSMVLQWQMDMKQELLLYRLYPKHRTRFEK